MSKRPDETPVQAPGSCEPPMAAAAGGAAATDGRPGPEVAPTAGPAPGAALPAAPMAVAAAGTVSAPLDRLDGPEPVAVGAQAANEPGRTVEVLRERELLFQALFDNHSAAMLVADADTGQLLEANPAAVGFYGWSLEQLLQMRFGDLEAPIAGPGVAPSAVDEPTPTQRQSRHRRADGSVRDVELHASRARSRDRDSLLIIVHDVTERTATEAALGERLKELSCLRQTQLVLDESPGLDQACRQVALLLVGGMQFPHAAVATVEVDGRQWVSCDQAWSAARTLTVDVPSSGGVRGRLAVHYTQDLPFLLPEETNLLEGVARALALWLGRDRSQNALRESEERLRLALAAGGHGLFDLDIESGEVIINAEYARMLGYEPGELQVTTTTWRERLHEDDRGPVSLALEEYLAGKRPEYRVDFRLRTKGGDWKWIRSLGQVVARSADGKPLRMLGTHTDITALKREEYQRSVELVLERVRVQVLGMRKPADWEHVFLAFDRGLRGLIPCRDVCINVIDWERDRFASYRWRAIDGFGVNTIEGIHPALKATVEAGVPVVRRRGDPLFDSIMGPEVNGVVDVPFLGGTVAANTADPEGFSATDIQILERFAPLLSEAYRHLEDQLQLEKSERKFVQAQKMEAVGQLAGGVAHDFNNLLTVVMGYGQLLLKRLAGDELGQTAVREILGAGERGSGLVRQLLAFSRRQVMVPEVLDLNRVIEGFQKMISRLVREDIRVVTRLAPELASVKADPGQIEQVLMNLAVNARDAMPDGGQLLIETANAEVDDSSVRQWGIGQTGSYVVLSVSDTGVGMDAATKARIFEPFFTTKELGKGTGLGLATVYGIVKQSEGYIWVYSEPGQGTTFRILLPRADGAPGAVPVPAATLAPGGHETVLVVEDEDSLRRLIEWVLREAGYTVLVARAGDEALQTNREHPGPIHLVVSDVVMPGMPGTELVHRLRAARPGLKVLLISGYAEQIALAQDGDKPDAAFLQKPFGEGALLAQVRQVLQGVVGPSGRDGLSPTGPVSGRPPGA